MLLYWKENTIKQLIGSFIWNLSERLDIPLGYLAPKVFGWMFGYKHKKIKSDNDNCRELEKFH